ncbi:MAG: hypothetical protein Q8K00_20070 [Syntrophales bacterium]|nr:hypothetical protein [Syntrophales bacterium]
MRNAYKHCSFMAAALTVLVMGCGMEEMYSAWCDRQVAIDGRDDGIECENALHSIAKGEITVGLLNDEKMLYLRLSTRNQAIQRQVLTTGLIVWFDETGGREKIYGIHFPLSIKNRRPGSERRPASGRDGAKRADPSDGPDQFSEISRGEIEIIRPGKNEHSMVLADDSSPYGIQCRIGNTKGTLVYELRVPLITDENSTHGIAMSKPKIIGIGLVTGEDEQLRQDAGDRGGGPGGGRGPGGMGGGLEGRGGGMGQPPQGPPGGMGSIRETMKPTNQWLKVHLAERP